MRTAYFDLIGGASGDMLLGALIDAGLAVERLQDELRKLNARGYRLRAVADTRGAIYGTHLEVELDDEGLRRRDWAEFTALIDSSALSRTVKEKARAVFDCLMAAEAQAHRSGHDTPKPHELGTVDTLVDVVGVVAALEALGVEQVHSSPFPAGSGTVRSGHGLLPVPAPATLAIFAASRAPVRSPGEGGPSGEAVTPTGAALITQLASMSPAEMSIERTGYGLGRRNPPDYPNVVGLWLGATRGRRADPATRRRGLSLLETNIDDMSGELFGYVQERLFEAGARDVWMTPIQMKKNRPGVLLSALVPDSIVDGAASLILRETSTLGVRARAVERYEAAREMVTVATSYGDLPVKVKRIDGAIIDVSPEYEACSRAARAAGVTLAEVMRTAAAEARAALGPAQPS